LQRAVGADSNALLKGHLKTMPLFETITDLAAGAETLKRRRYGVIEMAGGQFVQIRLRPWPKTISGPGIVLFGGPYHRHVPGDRLWLYYNQPRRFLNFLVLRYVVSTRASSFSNLVKALDVLDYIARLKTSDAALCDVGNWRVSKRLLARWGWTPHCPSRWHRHYIKRFYGTYPPLAKWIEELIMHDSGQPLVIGSQLSAGSDQPLAVSY
jgi:hypothetical protein